MELKQIFNLIGKWLWLILLSVVIAAGSSYYASRAATPIYSTKTTLMVGQITRNPEASSTDLYTGQQLAYTYSQLARREPVLQGAIESLELEMDWQALANQVSTAIVPQTQLLEISVVDSNPYRAKVLADAVAQQLILQSPAGSSLNSSEDLDFIRDQISNLMGKIETGQVDLNRLRQELDTSNSASQIQDLQNQINLLETKISDWQDTYSQLLLSLQGGDVNVLNVVEEAPIPGSPISPNIPMNVLVAAAIGFVLSAGGIVLMEYLDTTIKDADDLERATGLPTIGTIVRIDGRTHEEKLIAARQPLNPIVEEFRALRNNIQYSTLDKTNRLLLVTSTNPGEGKSICMANLAVVMANTGQRVILVDSDFRRPSQNQIFNLPNDTGLSTAIGCGDTCIDSYLRDVGIPNLKVLTSGPLPENPHQLLESERMREVLGEFKAIADVILFDSPPMMVVADAVVLGTLVDGVILIVESGNTRINEVRHMVNEMSRIHIPFIGAVLNRVPSKRRSSYYRHYYYNGSNNGRADGGEPNRLLGENIFGWLGRKKRGSSDPVYQNGRKSNRISNLIPPGFSKPNHSGMQIGQAGTTEELATASDELAHNGNHSSGSPREEKEPTPQRLRKSVRKKS